MEQILVHFTFWYHFYILIPRNMTAAAAKLPPTSKVNSKFDISLQCACAARLKNEKWVWLFELWLIRPGQFWVKSTDTWCKVCWKSLWITEIRCLVHSDFIKSEFQSMLKNRQLPLDPLWAGAPDPSLALSAVLRGAQVAKCEAATLATSRKTFSRAMTGCPETIWLLSLADWHKIPINIFVIRSGTSHFYWMSVNIRTIFPEILSTIQKS